MRRIARGVVIAGASLAVAGFGGSSSPDAMINASCPRNAFCVFEHGNGAGRMAAFRAGGGSPDLHRQRLDDAVSSLENRTSELWCFYADTDYRDQIGFVDGRTSGPINLRARYGGDRISSVRAC